LMWTIHSCFSSGVAASTVKDFCVLRISKAFSCPGSSGRDTRLMCDSGSTLWFESDFFEIIEPYTRISLNRKNRLCLGALRLR